MARYQVQLPAGASLILDVGVEDIDRTLANLQKKLSDRKKVLKTIANAMRADIRRQFKVGGDPAWKALKPATVLRKRMMGLPALTAKGRIPRRLVQNGNFDATNILIMTGRLRDAWGTLNSPNHFEKIDEQTGEIDMGTKGLDYAAGMQFGIKSKKVPARPVRITKPGAEEMRKAFARYLSSEPGVSIIEE